MNKLRYTMFIAIVFVTLTLSAMITVPALADDSAPPPTEAPTVEAPPIEEIAPLVEETSPASETITDTLASVPEGTDVVVVNAEGEILPLASTEATDIIDSNDPIWCPTGVAPNPGVGGCTTTQTTFNLGLIPLLNNKKANGTIWILGSYQGTVATPLTAIEGGPITLDGGSLGTTANYALTIKGGWTGATSGTIDPNNQSEFNVPFSIINWNNVISLSNILISGASGTGLNISTNKDITLNNVDAANNGGDAGVSLNSTIGNIVVNNGTFNGNSGNGLFASTGKNITISNIDAGNNGWYGIHASGGGAIVINNSIVTGNSLTGLLANTADNNITLNNVDAWDNGEHGADLNIFLFTVPGNIVVNDSTFNGNGSDGLRISTEGAITIKNISANDNTGSGANIYGSYDTPKPVTFTGSNNFKFNGEDGLVIATLGAISLNNVTAMYNGGYGAFLNNCFYDYAGRYCNTNGVVSSVTIKGTNNFSNNGWDGLRVWSNGAITLQNVTANDNGTDPSRPGATNPTDPTPPYVGRYDGTGKGVYLFNWAIPGKAITLIGTNTFNGNAETGLFIRSYGVVTLNNTTANNNGHSSNSPTSISDGVTVAASRGFKLLGYGIFNDNGDDGLEVSSYGMITISNVYAEGNTWWGVGLDSWGAVSAVNVLGTNTFVDNDNSGLHIWSEGAVTLNNITANENGVDGVYVDNCLYDDSDLSPLNWDCIVTTAKPVTLTGTNFFNGNAETGFNVFSTGVITTNNITALFNGAGVNLDNCIWETDPLVDDCKALAGKAVTMNGNNNINYNSGNGLYVQSLGAIKVNNLNASFNSGKGAILDNNWTAAVGGVTITGFSTTSSNGELGLGIYSRGAVLTSNLTANLNAPASDSSDPNDFDGVRIYNAANPLKLMSVTLLGINQFNYNWNSGLQISSFGVVVLNNITANNNGEAYDVTNNPTPAGDGVRIDNCHFDTSDPNPNNWHCIAITAAGVTLNGINIFNGNLEDGLSIQSKGTIVVNKVTAKYNGLNGAYLDNQFGAVNSALSLLGYGTFTGNGDTNLVVYSNGNIILNNVTADDSTDAGGASTVGGGAYIDNWSNTLTPVTVTLLGVNSFSGNAGDTGLVIYSDGAITLNNVTANDNNGDGALLNNTDYQIPLKVANITLNGTNTFVGNSLNGLEFSASGNVSLTRVTADLNDTGIFGTAAGTITLTCGSLDSNNVYGYYLTAGVGKLITLKGVFTYNNPSSNFSSFPTVSTRTCPLP